MLRAGWSAFPECERVEMVAQTVGIEYDLSDGNTTSLCHQGSTSVTPRVRDQKWLWLGAGTLLGLMIAYYCPHEPAYAETASQGEKFSMCTVTNTIAQTDAVFVLDNVTGRLTGGIFNGLAGGFTQSYFRNLAQDFNVTDNGQYVMVTGFTATQGTGGAAGTPATGAIYVGELNSGIVACYGFVFTQQANRPVPPRELVPLGTFPWRQSLTR